MRILKAIVIVLGVVILAASGFIAYTIHKRGARLGSSGQYAGGSLELPGNARVVTVNGSGDILSLLVQLGDGRQEIVTINRRTGQILGRLAVQENP